MKQALLLLVLAFALPSCNVQAPTGSCLEPLKLGLAATRDPNVFTLDLCGLRPTEDCLRREVELYVDDTLRNGIHRHGSVLELVSDPLEYVVYARDGSCLSPPVRILVP